MQSSGLVRSITPAYGAGANESAAQGAGPQAGTPPSSGEPVSLERVLQWINELPNPATREEALFELSRKREQIQNLAPILWHSFGVIASLLQEIVSIYPAVNPPRLTAAQSSRVCNALALLQCLASSNETRAPFLKAQIPLYLYPFLQLTSKTRHFEYIRLTSLGVIGALVKADDEEVVKFLIHTEIIPLCLQIMDSGSELSKTVAAFILHKILNDEEGLTHVCHTYDRFARVATVLHKLVGTLAKEPSARLLKYVIRCFLRLADNPRAREALRQCLPEQLRDATFAKCLQDDAGARKWLLQLLKAIDQPAVGVVGVSLPPTAAGGQPPAGLVPLPLPAGSNSLLPTSGNTGPVPVPVSVPLPTAATFHSLQSAANAFASGEQFAASAFGGAPSSVTFPSGDSAFDSPAWYTTANAAHSQHAGLDLTGFAPTSSFNFSKK